MRHASSPDAATAARLLREIFRHPLPPAPRAVDKPLVLYGAGNLGRMAKDYFGRLGIPIEFVVDANPASPRQDPFWAGLPILGSDEPAIAQRSRCMLALCVATSPFYETRAQLAAQGWADIVPFYDIAEAYRDRHPLSNGWFAERPDETGLRHIERVLSLWADDTSRAHHLQFIAWHALREDHVFDDAPVTQHDRYFIPSVCSILHEQEAFLDVGAHHGEVAGRFAEVVANRYRTIWAIEPDPENFSRLSRRIETMQNGDASGSIHALSVAVGAKEGRRPFMDGLGYASQLCPFGQRLADVATIDQLGLAPTFVKLHLEGAELDALEGAEQTIRKCRPIVTATSYHNSLGLWQLPQWLADHLPDYTFLMRLHSWCGTGSVIYCLPNERLGKERHRLKFLQPAPMQAYRTPTDPASN